MKTIDQARGPLRALAASACLALLVVSGCGGEPRATADTRNDTEVKRDEESRAAMQAAAQTYKTKPTHGRRSGRR